MLEDNLNKVNQIWKDKMEKDRRRWDEMRALKLKKGEEGEESLLLT